MPKDNEPPEPSFVSKLLTSMTGGFSAATKDYNEVVKAAEKLEKQNKDAANKNAIVAAYRTTLVNRYQAVKSVDGLRERAFEGFQWGWYFSMNKDLDKDVHKAGKVWLAHMIWPSMSIAAIVAAVKAAPKVAVTSAFTTQDDVDRLKKASKERVQQEIQSLTLSTAASLSIGKMLKTAGTFAQSEGTRLLAKSARGTWQLTGVLAFVYGLGKIHEVMSQTNGFDGPLRMRRDEFNAKEKAKYTAKLEYLAEGLQKGEDFGFGV